MITRLGLLFVALLASGARGDGLVVVGGSPRAIARAGAGTVGDDGGGALLVNPASLARRSGERVQLGIAIVDDSVAFDAPSVPGAPHVHDQAGSSIAPLAAVQGSIGDWVLGAGVITEAVTSRALRPPSDLPATEIGNSFPYRYTGIAGTIRRDTVTLGAARRFGESVALGLSVGAARVQVAETRRIWAGFSGRDTISDPARDVELGLQAEDGFAPRATLGILIAPQGTPFELGASVAWESTVHATGTLAAAGSSRLTSPTAAISLVEPWTLRAGARYVGEWLVVELDADLWLFRQRAESTSWDVRGVRVIDAPSGVGADLASVPSRVSERTHGAVRGAVDVELMSGFLWLIGGYAYTTQGTASDHLSPTFADLSGHTLGLGLEASAGGFALTLGWSRTWSVARAPVSSVFRLDNPFSAGDAPVTLGQYDATADQVGLLLDIELDPL